MQIGQLAGNFDVAELALALFFVAFLGLVVYLQRESNREGFPLQDLNGNPMSNHGLSGLPRPKTFIMPYGDNVSVPRVERAEVLPPHVGAYFPGGPIAPLGNKLASGLGPAAFASRADVPDRRHTDGTPRIVPTRADPTLSVAVEDVQPIGQPVVAADRIVVGKVHDVWIDRSEAMIRYYEVALLPAFSGRHVLVSNTMVDYGAGGVLIVDSALAAHFADAPGTKSMNEVTLLEEDQITAYFGGGTLYATPARAEPLL